MSWRRWSSVITLAAMVLAAVSASGFAQKTITVWHEASLDSHRDYFENVVVAGFKQEYPDIDVRVSFVENLDQAVRTALQAGAGPDVIYTPGPTFALEYIVAGLFRPLDEYADRWNWHEKVLPWALDLGRFEGKLYSLPLELEAMVVYYNKTLFADMGWQAPMTRDEMEAIAQKAQGAGIIPFAHGNGDWRPANEWHVGVFLNHYAGPEAVREALTGQRSWSDSLFVEAIELLNQYMQAGWFSGDLGNYYSLKGADRWSMLGFGEAAMNIEGSWAMSSANEYFGPTAGTDTDWDWVPVPTLRDGVAGPLYTIGMGSTISVNANSKNPEEAALFLDYLISDTKRAAKWIGDMGAVYNTPLPFAPDDFPEHMEPRFARFIADVSAATASGHYGFTTWTFWPARSDVYLYEEIERVWSGEITAREYLEGLQKVFDDEVASGRIPPIPR